MLPAFLAAIIYREMSNINRDRLIWDKLFDIWIPAETSLRFEGMYSSRNTFSMGPGQLQIGYALDLLWERIGYFRNNRQLGDNGRRGGKLGPWTKNIGMNWFLPEGQYRPIDVNLRNCQLLDNVFSPWEHVSGVGLSSPGENIVRGYLYARSGLKDPDFDTYDAYEVSSNISFMDDPWSLFKIYRNKTISFNDTLIRGLLIDDTAFNIDLTAQLIRRLASSQRKYMERYCTPNGYWKGGTIALKSSNGEDIWPDEGFKLSVLDKHGNAWPCEVIEGQSNNPFVIETNEYEVTTFFWFWEWAYNDRIAKGYDGYGGWDWGAGTPRLQECYNIVKDYYK